MLTRALSANEYLLVFTKPDDELIAALNNFAAQIKREKFIPNGERQRGGIKGGTGGVRDGRRTWHTLRGAVVDPSSSLRSSFGIKLTTAC